MRFAVCTCTGGRPELFALCRKWVERQTRKPDLWIVVTDTGEEIADLPPFARFLHVPPVPEDFILTGNGLASWSLAFALGEVPDGYAAIVMEDDDWYAPDHCQMLMSRIERGALVSYGSMTYRFHVPLQKWRRFETQGAIEGNIGIHPDGLARFIGSLQEDRFDPKDGIYPGFTKVDIKGVGYGLPGRTGATNHHKVGHKKTVSMMQKDPNNEMFRKLIGEADAHDYIRLVKS